MAKRNIYLDIGHFLLDIFPTLYRLPSTVQHEKTLFPHKLRPVRRCIGTGKMRILERAQINDWMLASERAIEKQDAGNTGKEGPENDGVIIEPVFGWAFFQHPFCSAEESSHR